LPETKNTAKSNATDAYKLAIKTVKMRQRGDVQGIWCIGRHKNPKRSTESATAEQLSQINI